MWRRNGRAGEFEDNFSDEQLIQAANEIAVDAKAVGDHVTLDEFVTAKIERPKVMTSKVLQRLYHEHFRYSLPKVDLAQKLAVMVAADIRSGEKQYQIVEALERLRAAATQPGLAGK
jgi:hypothetical protein